jgi:hypothetical protein
MSVSRAWILPIALSIAAGCATANDAQERPGGPDAATGSDSGTGSGDAGLTPCALRLAVLGYDFESGASGWTHAVMDGASAPGWPLDEWQVGAATSGPGSCHGGSSCWGTRLDANYTSCERAALTSPPIDLSMCAGQDVKLQFWSWHDFWTGTVSGKSGTWFDGGIVEISTDGTTWSPVTPSPAYDGTIAINPNISSNQCVSPNSFHVHNQPGFVGAAASWQQITVPLPASMVVSTFHVRFAYGSGVSFANSDAEVDRQHTRPGWYVDDISFAK